MGVELPDLDMSVSFVVDDGEAVGPLSLREIAQTIAAGERSDDAYVWWSGASEWMRFNSEGELVALLAEPPSVEELLLGDEEAPVEEEPTSNDVVAQADEFDDAGDVERDEAEIVVEEIAVAEDLGPEVIDLTAEPDPLDQIPLTESSVLSDVGARLDALASATRHVHNSSKIDSASTSPSLRLVSSEDDVDLREVQGVVSDVRASTLETGFDVMVRRTENHGRLLEQGARVRELLARACGAALSRQGYSVERRNESGGCYFLGFESSLDSRQMNLEISSAASVSDESGHHVHLVLSWGRTTADLDDALQVVHDQLPVADRPLGTISSDAQIDTGLVSTRVELIWSVDDYIDGDFTIDRGQLEASLDATQQALENRWYDLFEPAD